MEARRSVAAGPRRRRRPTIGRLLLCLLLLPVGSPLASQEERALAGGGLGAGRMGGRVEAPQQSNGTEQERAGGQRADPKERRAASSWTANARAAAHAHLQPAEWQHAQQAQHRRTQYLAAAAPQGPHAPHAPQATNPQPPAGKLLVLDRKRGQWTALLPGLLDDSLLARGSFAFQVPLVRLAKLKVYGNVYAHRLNGGLLRDTYQFRGPAELAQGELGRGPQAGGPRKRVLDTEGGPAGEAPPQTVSGPSSGARESAGRAEAPPEEEKRQEGV